MTGGGGVGTAGRRTATFLFTDLEGSTRLLERLGDEYADVLAEHWRILRDAATAHGGIEFGAEGDAMFFAFETASAAARAAVDAQRTLAATAWPEGVGGDVKVRMALHTGQARIVFGQWVGLALHHAARICAAGHGGQILVSPATAALLAADRPPGVRVEALGEYRLRDITEPQAIGQLEHEDLRHAFPPLRTPVAEVTNLPNALTSFVGRASEITELGRLVERHRLVTITGPGGAGKTRLAYEVAGAVGPHFPDGVWVAELASVAEGDGVGVARIAAAAVGAPFDESAADGPSWMAALRGRRLLLVLDNCEHVVEAAASLADDVRRASPGVHVLATSREALRVHGEQVWPVPPMGEAAVRLFAERAVLARPLFEVSSANEDAVRRICERLDGLPLAVELAAARVATLDVQEIEGRLDDRFRLLRRGVRTALPRQQTLQALIDWSHDLLDDDERRVFRRLGAFAGSFTVARAARVVGADEADVEDVIDQLVAKSLVVREDGPDGTTRFRLLETLRAYAAARLDEARELDAARAGLLDAVAALADEAGRQVLGPDQRRWLDLLDAEWVDVERALTAGLDRDPARVLEAAGAIAPFFAIRGHVGPGRSILETALQQAAPVATRAEDPTAWWARVRALAAAGTLARAANDLDAAGRHHLAQLDLVRGDPDEELVAKALSSLGNVRLLEGRVEEARGLCEESLAIRRRLGTPRPLALALNNLGVLADLEGDYAAAEAAYAEHLAIMRGLGDVRVVGQTLTNLALVHLATGRLDDAAAALDESLTLLRDVGDTRSIGVTTAVEAGLLRRRGDFEGARSRCSEALRMLDDLGDLAGIGMALDGIATTLAAAGGEAGLVTAARLLGATSNLPIGPGERGRGEDEEVARAAAAARATLGEAVFEAAFGAGAAAPLAEIVAEGLAARLR